MNWKMKGVASLCVYLCLAVTLSSLIVSVNSSPDTVFSIIPPSFTGSVDDTITLGVKVTDASFLYSWQVYMSWDDTILSYSSHVFGGFLTDQPEGSSTNVRIESDFTIIGEATVGSYGGKSAAEGWLYNVTFVILQEIATTIHIDHATFTYYIEVFTPPQQIKITDFAKENCDFAAPWAEDFNKDGWVDIWDISVVCILYGEPLIVTKDPSSVTADPDWTTPENAYVSDNAYASTNSKNVIATYSDYGFYAYDGGIASVEVGIEAYTLGAEKIEVSVSNDGGTTWSATAHTVFPGASDTDTVEWVDVTADFAWTPTMLTDAYFKVKIMHVVVGGAKWTYVDWLPVRVTYDPVADLDNSGGVDITDLSMVAVKFGETYL